MAQPDRLLAYRLLLRKGEWDVDRFFREIPASKWEELRIAHAIIEDYDGWIEAVKKGYKKPWVPPKFETKKKTARRRLSGAEY